MTGKVLYLLQRDGRYYARLVVPKPLRLCLENKTELRTPLGPDYRTALRELPGAVAALQTQIQRARSAASSNGVLTPKAAPFPMTIPQMAQFHYNRRLRDDEDMRNRFASAYSGIQIDDGFAKQLRRGVAGQMSDGELALQSKRCAAPTFCLTM